MGHTLCMHVRVNNLNNDAIEILQMFFDSHAHMHA